MTNDNGKKPKEFWIAQPKQLGTFPIVSLSKFETKQDDGGLYIRDYLYGKFSWLSVESIYHVREVAPCPNCERLEDRLYHESRKAPEVEYKLGHEIERLQAQLAMCKEVLNRVYSATGELVPNSGHMYLSTVNYCYKVSKECLAKLEGEK